MISEATTQPDTKADPGQQTKITLSGGLAAWLREHRCSIVFTSYQTGKVGVVGLRPDDSIAFQVTPYARALGFAAGDTTVWLASLTALWRLEDGLAKGTLDQGRYDRRYEPRLAYITGDLDVHELAADGDGQPVFVNTKYSCLATVSATAPFQVVWKPAFVSKLVPEDRCHLNGLAMENGSPRYVTAVSKSDVVEGWRARRSNGGLLIDVRSGDIVAESLSIPHSPRVHNGRVIVLESGRGQIVSIDPSTGAREDICFCPGFLRGLALHDGFALVTTSHARDGTFQDLPLEHALGTMGQAPVCALHVVDLQKRAIVEKVTFTGQITELFAVSVLPDVRLPLIEAPERGPA